MSARVGSGGRRDRDRDRRERGSLHKGDAGLSPIVSSLILCGCVLIAGISIWGFAYSASTVIQWDYFEEMTDKMATLRERFVIENLIFSKADGKLYIWIYNFGVVPVQLDVYVYRASVVIGSNLTGFTLQSDEMVEVRIPLQDVYAGDLLIVQAISRRGNRVYDSVSIPT